ncbi:MAG: hypothetical protein H5U13_07115 [Parvibaculum sp.]|nr:hypothetical protein [Parvibaculum sp.]
MPKSPETIDLLLTRRSAKALTMVEPGIKIPEWEQLLPADAVCQNMLIAGYLYFGSESVAKDERPHPELWEITSEWHARESQGSAALVARCAVDLALAEAGEGGGLADGDAGLAAGGLRGGGIAAEEDAPVVVEEGQEYQSEEGANGNRRGFAPHVDCACHADEQRYQDHDDDDLEGSHGGVLPTFCTASRVAL